MKYFKFLFSGWFMGLLLVVFAYAIGYAAFVYYSLIIVGLISVLAMYNEFAYENQSKEGEGAKTT